jgi:hypothetical protein
VAGDAAKRFGGRGFQGVLTLRNFKIFKVKCVF